jgi:kynurenine formamidase
MNKKTSLQDARNAVSRRDLLWGAGVSAFGMALAGLMQRAEAKPPAQAPGKTKVFIRQVKEARLFDLSPVWDENSPIASVNPPYSMMLTATHANTISQFDGHLSFTAEEFRPFSGQHGAPSIDAIGHIGRDGKLFGGVDAFAATSNPLGIGRSGVGAHLDIAHYPTDLLVNRGVLLDVARFIQGDLSPLPGAFEITAKHLADTAAAQKVALEPGDTVLIRTGWGKHFSDDPNLYVGPDSPGPSVDGAQFLVANGARVVGNDTLTFEKRPPLIFSPTFQIFPVHMLLIADNGINIIENFVLEELAAARVYEFLIVVPPLKIRGGTGSALRAFALAPDVPPKK